MSEIVIGIDPGSRFTGYGIVKLVGNETHYLGSGCIKTGNGDLASKLKIIFDGVTALIEQFKPTSLAKEVGLNCSIKAVTPSKMIFSFDAKSPLPVLIQPDPR